MALNVYTDRSLIPQGLDIVFFGDRYFDANTYLSDDVLVSEILFTVDKARYHTKYSFISRVPNIGALNKSCLSTGTKTILNVINHPDVCFSIECCGGNVLDFIPRLHDGNILWENPVLHYSGNPECDIILNGTAHYSDMFDFLDVINNGGNESELDIK